MATTLSDLIEETLTFLRGYVRSQEQTTWLTSSITSSDTSLSVANGSRIGMGRVEIDNELLYVDSLSGTTAVVSPWGRGMDGSTADAHSSNARVTFSPLFPRHQVLTQINSTIKAIGKEIQASASTTITFQAPKTTYALPADVNAVSDVSWQVVGPSRLWTPVKRWKFNQVVNTTTWATGKTIDIFDSITPGRTVQISYLKLPSELSSPSDTLETTTGFPAYLRDVVVLGAAARLVSGIDVSLLDPTSISAGFFDERRAPGSGSQVARTLYALYQQRLMEETDRFRDQYPTPVHYRR